jgi:LexA DNA binding domain-containing protein
MAKEIFPSSYLCNCGHQLEFSENTVRELKQKSKRKRQWLIETLADRSREHVVVFDGGKMVDLLCPDDGGPKRKSKFTRKQGQYLAFIHQYTSVHGVPPAEYEMQRRFSVSPASVHQMVLNLEKRRLIERIPGAARSIKVLVPAEELPLHSGGERPQ